MSEFRFLHAADLHIDSPLRGLSRYEGAPAEELRGATRRAFENLVSCALQREVAFVILAGDLFDGDWPDYGTGLWFLSALQPLLEAGIGVHVVRGNHDAAGRVERNLTWPEGVVEYPVDAPATVRIEDLGVALHGQGYAQAEEKQDLARDYPAPVPGMLNIGLLHTALEGRPGHEPYAPCTARSLVDRGYDYWALGHVHTREVVQEDPWIVFPGNLQGRHARETGPRGATLVHVADGRIARLEELHLDVCRWERVEVDLTGADSLDALRAAATHALLPAVRSAEDRTLAVRVELRGTTELDATLRRSTERVRNEVRAAALGLEARVWVEKVLLATDHPAGLATGADGEEGSGLAHLVEAVEGAELSDEEFGTLADELQALRQKLSAARVAFDPTDATTLRDTLEPARRFLAALLADGDPRDEEPA